MTKYKMHFDIPEEAYFEFYKADASQNGDASAAVMSYPHVRVAANGPTMYFNTARDYADDADWTSRIATGWVLTRGREPVRFHESPNKVHLVGGWTRYNADDDPILWNRVTYIVTKPADSWGIQARFALGTYHDGQDDETAIAKAVEIATDYVQRYYDALDKNDGDACATLCRFPLLDVGVGEVTRIESAAELAQQVNERTTSFSNVNIEVAQSGPEGVLLAVTADEASGNGEQAILVVGKVEGVWTIGGISRI